MNINRKRKRTRTLREDLYYAGIWALTILCGLSILASSLGLALVAIEGR